MTPRRLLAVVLVVGIAIGCATTLLARAAPTRASRAPVAGASSAPVQRVPVTPIGAVTIAARTDDPGGNLRWAVRRFVTRQRNHTFPCVQLGRLDGTRFGWVAPTSPFRLARLDLADVPASCGTAFPRGLPQLTVITLTTDATSGLPQLARTIIWGTLPPRFTSARLSDGTQLRAGRDGVVLTVLPGRPVGEPPLVGTMRTSNGAQRRFDFPKLQRENTRPMMRGRDGSLRPRPGGTALIARARIAARVPDPAGGAAWAILTAPSTSGATCFTTPAHVVGDRLATVEPRLGIARPYPFTDFDCSGRRAPTAAHPLRADVLGSSIPEQDPVGTQQLRRLNDRTVLHARTTADVTAVTITTSRDIRTVVPDPRTYVVMAVYDGTFPGERIKVTATLRSGRRVTVMQPSGS